MKMTKVLTVAGIVSALMLAGCVLEISDTTGIVNVNNNTTDYVGVALSINSSAVTVEKLSAGLAWVVSNVESGTVSVLATCSNINMKVRDAGATTNFVQYGVSVSTTLDVASTANVSLVSGYIIVSNVSGKTVANVGLSAPDASTYSVDILRDSVAGNSVLNSETELVDFELIAGSYDIILVSSVTYSYVTNIVSDFVVSSGVTNVLVVTNGQW